MGKFGTILKSSDYLILLMRFNENITTVSKRKISGLNTTEIISIDIEMRLYFRIC